MIGEILNSSCFLRSAWLWDFRVSPKNTCMFLLIIIDTPCGGSRHPCCRWDYILGSDIVFNEELFAPLISSLLSLTELVPDKVSLPPAPNKCHPSDRPSARPWFHHFYCTLNRQQSTVNRQSSTPTPKPSVLTTTFCRHMCIQATKDGGRKSAGVRRTKILLTYRERERCARHGCYWREFFGELANHFDVSANLSVCAVATHHQCSMKLMPPAPPRAA